MLLMPVTVPAEIHRVGADDVVARGPLLIMAHGLLAIEPARRDHFMIRSEIGEFDAAEAEQVLLRWNGPRPN